MTTREGVLVRTMVDLADTLVDDFDVIDLLSMLSARCVEVLDLTASGIMLAGPDGELHLMASSDEAMRVVELFEIQAQEGPCSDCFHSGVPVVTEDLAVADGRWPRFAPVALARGFRAAHALPMRLRGNTIGALNLFHAEAGPLEATDIAVGQALADIASIALIQHRAVTEARALNEQLTHALDSRVVIEQAKGILATQAHLDMDAAFRALRNHARANSVRLVEVARAVATGELSLDPLAEQRGA